MYKSTYHMFSTRKTRNCNKVPHPGSNQVCLRQKVGVCDCPLKYVVRELATVAVLAPPLQAGEPHSEEHGGPIKGDMIAQMLHLHSFFKVDNGVVFNLIETTVHGTPIPFCCNQNGCRAFFAIQAQHAGKDVWDKLVKEAKTVLQNRKW